MNDSIHPKLSGFEMLYAEKEGRIKESVLLTSQCQHLEDETFRYILKSMKMKAGK